MSRNFLSDMKKLKKQELIDLLKNYNFQPIEEKEKYEGFFNTKLTKSASNWLKGVKYYDPKQKKSEIYKLLIGTIVKNSGIKKQKNDDLTAYEILTQLAELSEVPVDAKMSNREIENQILLYETESMFPVYLLAIRTMKLMSQQESVGLTKIQKKIIDSFLEELITTKEQKQILQEETNKQQKFKDLSELMQEVGKNKKINKKQMYGSILGFAWIIAISDEIISRKEINFYKKLYEFLEIKEADALKIKNKIEQNFEKVRDEIVKEMQKKGNKLGNNDLSEASSGVAGSLLLIGLAESAGFGLFLFATNALYAVGALFGITFSFATYTTLTTTLGILTGPVGWIGIPLIVAGGYLTRRMYTNQNLYKTKEIVLNMAYLRGDI